MLYGKPFTAAFGPTSALILNVKGVSVGGSLRAQVTVRREFAERFFAFWVNEVYIGNYWCDEDGVFELTLPANYGTSTPSIYIEDVGLFPSFTSEDAEYLWHARDVGAATSKNLVMEWSATGLYTQSTVYGDSQLSSITITGAKRGVNVEDVPDMPTRGRLRYSLINNSGRLILRWWNGNTLVSEGERGGDGVINCTEVEDSGIAVAATATYTTAVNKSDAWVDLKWPKSYQIHYSTSSLSYPRTPEDTVYDRGDGAYSYIAYNLSAGTYNFNVVPVDDEDTPQSSPSAPADSPLTINAAPLPPTVTGRSGSAAAGITFTFTNGEAGCTYTLYMSKKNEPINFGDLTGGFTPVTTALNATTVTSAVIADYAEEDLETAYDALETAWASAVSTANTAFSSGATGFSTAFTTFTTAILAALADFVDDTGFPMTERTLQITESAAAVQSFVDEVGTNLETDTIWKTQCGVYYGGFLAMLGAVLKGDPNRWIMPNGTIAGSLGGGSSSNLSVDGELGETPISNSTILQLCTPYLRPAKFYALIRATKGGIEEQNGSVIEIEIDDATGALVEDRPNKAQIESISIDGLDVTVVGGIFDEEAAADAESLELYIHTGIYTLGTPDDTQVLPTSGIGGYRTVTFDPVTVGAAGWHRVFVVAVSADGARSALFDEEYIHIDTSAPSGVLSLRGFVARSKGR